MAQLNTVAFRNKYRSVVDNNGVPAQEIDFIDIGSVFDTENGAVLYLMNVFIPSWDINASGSLPDYFLVKSLEAERIYHIPSGANPSIYVTLWANV